MLVRIKYFALMRKIIEEIFVFSLQNIGKNGYISSVNMQTSGTEFTTMQRQEWLDTSNRSAGDINWASFSFPEMRKRKELKYSKLTWAHPRALSPTIRNSDSSVQHQHHFIYDVRLGGFHRPAMQLHQPYMFSTKTRQIRTMHSIHHDLRGPDSRLLIKLFLLVHGCQRFPIRACFC